VGQAIKEDEVHFIGTNKGRSNSFFTTFITNEFVVKKLGFNSWREINHTHSSDLF